MNFKEHRNLSSFFDENIMIPCSDFNEVSLKIKQAQIQKIKKSDCENYIKKHIGRFDGNCSLTAADAIFQIYNLKNKF